MKKTLTIILFPFVFLWMCLAYLIYKIGEGLCYLGNWMSGWKIDTSFGKVY